MVVKNDKKRKFNDSINSDKRKKTSTMIDHSDEEEEDDNKEFQLYANWFRDLNPKKDYNDLILLMPKILWFHSYYSFYPILLVLQLFNMFFIKLNLKRNNNIRLSICIEFLK